MLKIVTILKRLLHLHDWETYSESCTVTKGAGRFRRDIYGDMVLKTCKLCGCKEAFFISDGGNKEKLSVISVERQMRLNK